MDKMVFFVVIIIFSVFFVVILIHPDDTGFKNGAGGDSAEAKTIVRNNYSSICIVNRTEKIVNGDSMEPMIKSGETLILLEKYYDCNDVDRGDVVAYSRKQNDNPLIKTVLALPGDELIFEGNRSNATGVILLINGQVLKNSAGTAYEFSQKSREVISLYVKDGKLIEDGYLIFGDNILSSMDSREFGAVGKEAFLGRFEID